MAKVGSKKSASSKIQSEQRSQGSPIWVFLTILFLVLFLTTLYLYFNKSDSVFSLLTGATTTTETQEQTQNQELCIKAIDKNQISEMAIDYFNQKVLGDGKAVIIRTDESDLVYIIKMAYNNKVYESYVSKDGRFFFPTGYELYNPKPVEANEPVTTDEPV
jgi:hypothetical protein